MTAALSTQGLGKRYGRRWALRDCTMEVPTGKVVGLVGPNGAGKSTLLQLAVGLLAPTAGGIEVLGRAPAADAEQLGRVSFMAQDAPVYSNLTVADHLSFGAAMNPTWDADGAAARIRELGLDPRQRAGRLSGGQRAQLALTIAVSKRPELLVLDEPVASLDPLARREFLQDLMAIVAERGISVVLSSHLVADLERVCDHLIVLVGSRVRHAGDIDTLLAEHHRLVGPRRERPLPSSQQIVAESCTERQSTLLIRSAEPVRDPSWQVSDIGLEDLVLAYLGAPGDEAPSSRPLSAVTS